MIPEGISLYVGWLGVLGGVVAGSAIGLFVHRESWMGGYGSYPRRMVRLGHISFFGLGAINILFALTLRELNYPLPYADIAALSLVVGAVTMPLCCFLAAWRKPLRHLFPVPVISVFVGLVILLLGWQTS